VTWVPIGMHPLRQAMRQRKLGGYDVPEIDYGIRNLYQEMLEGGFTSVTVTPLDLFGYRLVCENPGTGRWWFFRGLNLISKVIPPGWMPLKFRERHAYALASVGRVAMR
jgi:hypothetical protein